MLFIILLNRRISQMHWQLSTTEFIKTSYFDDHFISIRSSESEYHFSYYPIPESDEVIQVKLKRSSNCTAFKTWEACFAFLEWILEKKGLCADESYDHKNYSRGNEYSSWDQGVVYVDK